MLLESCDRTWKGERGKREREEGGKQKKGEGKKKRRTGGGKGRREIGRVEEEREKLESSHFFLLLQSLFVLLKCMV